MIPSWTSVYHLISFGLKVQVQRGHNITKLTFFRFDANDNDVPLSEVEIPYTFKGCQKLSIKTRQKLQQLGYNGEF